MRVLNCGPMMFGVGLASLLAIGSGASAATLFSSNGFESSAGYVADLSLTGQPASGAPNDIWQATVAGSTTGGFNRPTADVLVADPAFGPGNSQYVLVVADNMSADGFGYFAPRTNIVSPYTTAIGEVVSVTWTMDIISNGGVRDPGHAFFGITAFGKNGSFGTEAPIATAGIDATTGGLYGANVPTTFNAAADTFYDFQLLLNFATQSYTIGAKLTDVAGPYATVGTGDFLAPATVFTEGAIATQGVDGTASTGFAAFDNYNAAAIPAPPVPEPATLTGFATVAFGLLGRRRARV